MDNTITSDRRVRSFAVPDVILVATDLENDIDYLLPHVMAQARASGASVILAHVVLPAESLPLNSRAVSAADAVEVGHAAKQRLHAVAATLQAGGIPCDIVIRYGLPTEAIPRLVETTRADRLILGTHGRRHLKRLALGSVANEILRKVDVPVCTIGPHVSGASSHETPRKILHPVSLSAGYEHSAQVALQIAQFYNAEITLLHVLDHGHYSEQIVEWTRMELERLIPEEAPLWIFSAVQVETGAVVEQILNVADEMQADLIVLGVNREASFWPISDDSTTYEIIAQAKCPVLTVRRLAHGHEGGKANQKASSERKLANPAPPARRGRAAMDTEGRHSLFLKASGTR